MHKGVTSWQPIVVHAAAAVAYLLTIERLRILHDFIQYPEYYLRRHLTLQLGALQLQIGVELRNSQRESWLESAAKCREVAEKRRETGRKVNEAAPSPRCRSLGGKICVRIKMKNCCQAAVEQNFSLTLCLVASENCVKYCKTQHTLPSFFFHPIFLAIFRLRSFACKNSFASRRDTRECVWRRNRDP